jgi:hypothetical protein
VRQFVFCNCKHAIQCNFGRGGSMCRRNQSKEQSMTNVTLLEIPSANQHAVGQDLMDELRGVINAPKYDNMTVATVIGVLEMVKLHYWQQSE